MSDVQNVGAAILVMFAIAVGFWGIFQVVYGVIEEKRWAIWTLWGIVGGIFVFAVLAVSGVLG